jgi:hypothetical protein
VTEEEQRRLEAVAAQTMALHIIVSALVDLFPDPELLRSTIETHAKGLLSAIPTDIEENRQYVESVWRKLNAFWPLLQETDQ